MRKIKFAPQIFILVVSLLLIVTSAIADGYDPSKPSHTTLYTDTITSKTDGSSLNI